MRIPIIGGNWKMHTTVAEARTLAEQMVEKLDDIANVEKVLCPPFISLTTVAEVIDGTSLKLGAQNMYPEEKGAYTGEIAPTMLEGLCQYVILGHSERRGYFNESDEFINKKVKAALAHNLIPIICVGESLEQNKAGQTAEVVGRQVKGVLADLSAAQVAGLVFAYEPIWAIGTGLAATGDVANSIIGETMRGVIAKLYDEETAQTVRIQYGGSVKGKNAPEFMTQPDIDGALVGGASLKPDDFKIIAETAASKMS